VYIYSVKKYKILNREEKKKKYVEYQYKYFN
jgi:hypothetical protein